MTNDDKKEEKQRGENDGGKTNILRSFMKPVTKDQRSLKSWMNVVRLVVDGSTGGFRGTLFHKAFSFFSQGLLPTFDAVECHWTKRDSNCARLVKDQLPPSSFKKRLRSYSR